MDATYTLGRVASAADTPTPVLSRYLEHGVIRLRHGDVDSSTLGIPRQFGLRRVLQVALTRTLNKLGVAPQRAADAALVWTDQGAPSSNTTFQRRERCSHRTRTASRNAALSYANFRPRGSNASPYIAELETALATVELSP